MDKKILIEDILLKMNYDLSKTLTENKEFINEHISIGWKFVSRYIGYNCN
jgi:hypothetical protein